MPNNQLIKKYIKIEFNYKFLGTNTKKYIFDSSSVVYNGLVDIDTFIEDRISSYSLIGLEVYSYSIYEVTESLIKSKILKEGCEQIEI